MAARQRPFAVRSFLLAACCGVGLGSFAGCGDDDSQPGGNGAGAGSSISITPAPGGIRRLTSSQMSYSIEYLLGADAAATFDVWDDPQLHGFESIAAAELAIGANDVSALEQAVTLAVDTSLLDSSHIAQFASCVSASPTTECYTSVATDFARVAWRRPVEDDERERLVAIATAAQEWGSGDFNTGLKYELMAIFQSPNFVYQVEIGVGDGPKRPLDPYGLASRLSFFIVHRTPDVELLDAAESGALDSDEGIRTQVRRLLATPDARRSVDRFFAELYLIRDIDTLDKDAALYPGWNESLGKSMQEEMLRFLQDIVWTRNADSHEVFTSTKTFVDANLAPFYGVAAPASGWGEAELPEGKGRVGLLGKAGFLARFSHQSETSPTRRGRFYREKILCREIPSPPAGTDQTLPEPAEPTTLKAKLDGHVADEQCAGCHALTDPIGLAYQHFDAVGQWREKENGFDIDTAGKSIDIEFEGPEDLASYAAENSAACFVQNFWRGSMGHEETEGELEAMASLEDDFAASGFKIQDLMVELTVNPGFKTVGEPK